MTNHNKAKTLESARHQVKKFITTDRPNGTYTSYSLFHLKDFCVILLRYGTAEERKYALEVFQFIEAKNINERGFYDTDWESEE